jgi:hypothetical protein
MEGVKNRRRNKRGESGSAASWDGGMNHSGRKCLCLPLPLRRLMTWQMCFVSLRLLSPPKQTHRQTHTHTHKNIHTNTLAHRQAGTQRHVCTVFRITCACLCVSGKAFLLSHHGPKLNPPKYKSNCKCRHKRNG